MSMLKNKIFYSNVLNMMFKNLETTQMNLYNFSFVNYDYHYFNFIIIDNFIKYANCIFKIY